MYRIRENYKVSICTNPISGHSWIDHGKTASYSVVGPTGEVSKHRTLKGAEKELTEWGNYSKRIKEILGE
jgi:hypothetical protein